MTVYYVPEAKQHLLSPQHYLQNSSDPTKQHFVITATHMEFVSEHRQKATIKYHHQNNLPTIQMWNSHQQRELQAEDMEACVLNVNNMNLTPPQKELLRWHFRLCHQGFDSLQRLLRTGHLGNSPLSRAAAKCDIPTCSVCEFAKAKRRPTTTKQQHPVPFKTHALKRDQLYPGQWVSMAHFMVTERGRLYTSMGKTTSDLMYAGSCIFVDHATGDVHVEHLLNFTTTETLQAKDRYKKRMADMGVTVQAYQADNGIFAACDFINNIESSLQNINFSGAGAHHQNGIAERAIQSIISKARRILMHAAIHWPSMVETNLWPMAVDYAVYHHNHMPRPSVGMLVPIDLLLKTQSARTHFHDMHVWGCPCYILDPKLQDGHKLPKWKPSSRRGMFAGFSPRHSSLAPLVLNPRTGKISPQFHVIFDDWFTSVLSVGADDAFEPSMWQTLFSHSRFHYMCDDHDAISLSDDWTHPGLQTVLDDPQHQLN